MVDLKVLKSRGVSTERLEKLFSATEGPDLVTATRIRGRIRDRIARGIQDNLANYRFWLACDMAWDVPFRQVTPTLVQGLLDRKAKTADILSVMQGVDISNMLVTYDKSGKVISKLAEGEVAARTEVHAPTFFNIFIPLAKAYTTIRTAAIVNSYRQVPMFEYSAAKSTKINRVKAEVITDRIEMMSTQYGYYDVIKQAVLHMLHYSVAYLFPVEEWHSKRQILTTPGGESEVIEKEGVRWHIPHLSRVSVDGSHRPSTINTNTGVSFGFYWHMIRFGEVMQIPGYWHTDKVTISAHNYLSSNPTFFNTVYNSCAMKFAPNANNDIRDREGARNFYSMAGDEDKPITLTEYFECVNPKTEGIGDYDYDVWFRYVVASDDTPVYGAPLVDNPIVYFGYDALETRSHNPSMTLEVLPFQDHISNLFTQYLLTIKQNLSNLTFFDINQVDKETIDWIKNLGEGTFRTNNFAGMDMRQNRIGQNNIQEAFTSFKFPQQDTAQLLAGVKELLSILDRLMVLSPQELAQTASHELTAEEVRNMTAAKSTRYDFTAGAVDRGVYALKSYLYKSLMAYGHEDVYARLPQPVDAASLETLGFTVEEMDGKHVHVNGKKSAIWIESFASTRDGDLRVNNTAAATAMVQMLSTVLSNPGLTQEVGLVAIIELINEISQIAGLPRDFRFVPTGGAQEQQVQAMQEQLLKLAKQIQESAVQESAKSIIPVLKEENDRISRVEAAMNKLLVTLGQPGMPPNENPNSGNPQPAALPGGPPQNPGMAQPPVGPAIPAGAPQPPVGVMPPGGP